jgi:hypothetical protein
MTRIFASALVSAVCMAAAISSPAMAERDAPPGNSGQQQYTESLPVAGGTRPTRELSASSHHDGSSGPGSGGGAGQSGTGVETPISPTEAFGAAKAHRFAKAGPAGRAAARLAAAGLAAPKKSAAKAAEDTRTSSRLSQVVGQLTGTESSQGMGLLLPLIIVVTLALAVGFLAARWRPARTRS